MRDEPDIVKELKKQEKEGKLKVNNKKSEENINQKYEKVKIIDNGLKIIDKKIDIANIKDNYQSFFENYAVAITIADENERIVSWNKYAEDLLEMSESDFSLREVSSLYPEEEWRKIRSEDIRQKGMKFKLETKMKNKSGKLFLVSKRSINNKKILIN